jgi:hypothetical protein
MVRRNMRCLVTVGKHVNNIRAITRQPPITIKELFGAVFSVGSVRSIYNEDPRPTQWNLESSVAGYSPDKKDLRVGKLKNLYC